MNQNKGLIAENDLADNPTPRTPLVLCLDVSGSMRNEPIAALNKGIKTFYEAIRNDRKARLSVELAIVTFEFNANVIEEFSLIEHKVAPTLIADGGTALGSGLELALNMVEARKAEYKMHSIDYHQPIILLMTDGNPGDLDVVKRIIPRIHKLESENILTLYPIAVGNDVDQRLINSLSCKNHDMRISTVKFDKLFVWLGQSIKAISSKSVSVQSDEESNDLNRKNWRKVFNS